MFVEQLTALPALTGIAAAGAGDLSRSPRRHTPVFQPNHQVIIKPIRLIKHITDCSCFSLAFVGHKHSDFVRATLHHTPIVSSVRLSSPLENFIAETWKKNPSAS